MKVPKKEIKKPIKRKLETKEEVTTPVPVRPLRKTRSQTKQALGGDSKQLKLVEESLDDSTYKEKVSRQKKSNENVFGEIPGIPVASKLLLITN